MDILSVTVGLAVKDLKKSVKWYRKVFEPQEETQPMEEIAELKLGPVWLQLFQKPAVPGDGALRFGVADLEAQRARLKKMRLKAEEITDIPGIIRYFDFSDPDGNLLSMYQLPQ